MNKDLRKLARAYITLVNLNEELIVGKKDFVAKIREMIEEGELLEFLTVFYRETGVLLAPLEFLDEVARIEDSLIATDDPSAVELENLVEDMDISTDSRPALKIHEVAVFQLILNLIIAAESAGVMSLRASRRRSQDEFSLQVERLESLRQCLLVLFNQVLGGKADARARAFEYISQEGFAVNDKLLDWLWGSNAFSEEDLCVPDGVRIQ